LPGGAAGVKEIPGRVVVGASLFAEGARELGTTLVLSPAVVNDNLVDVMAIYQFRAGDAAG
jgi:hypothetical protein